MRWNSIMAAMMAKAYGCWPWEVDLYFPTSVVSAFDSYEFGVPQAPTL